MKSHETLHIFLSISDVGKNSWNSVAPLAQQSAAFLKGVSFRLPWGKVDGGLILSTAYIRDDFLYTLEN